MRRRAATLSKLGFEKIPRAAPPSSAFQFYKEIGKLLGQAATTADFTGQSRHGKECIEEHGEGQCKERYNQ